MKKLLYITLLSLLVCTCTNKKDFKQDIEYLKNNNFVYLQNNKFKINDTTFFPLMLNYSVSIRKIDNEYVLSSIKDYESPNDFEGNTVDSSLIVLKGHLQLIKELGFNSIRLIGLNSINTSEKKPFFMVYKHKNEHLEIKKDNYKIIFSVFKQFLKIADDLDLRVMVLLKAPINDKELEDFTISLFKEFKDNPTIFAYDFINEPLYFDNKDLKSDDRKRTKESALEIVEHWKEMMIENAPNQMMTIGFSEPIEVFEWDPAILPVDFLAFHTYQPLRVPNEIYWYSKYTQKPWMIGETALPADNDSISYTEQTQFLKEVYRRTVNCGGLGLAWWSFQDVNWGGFEHNYTSIMNHKGKTYTKDSTYCILGTLKPVAYEFKNLNKYKPNFDCPCMSNYYNMLGYKNYVLSGKIVDEDNNPVEGAVIRGWTNYFGIGSNTYSNADGIFHLYSNDKYSNFEISAPKMTKLKFAKEIKYYLADKQSNITTADLKNIDLEYQSISYKPFLVDKTISDSNFVPLEGKSYIFNFKKDMFDKYIFKADMGILELEKIDF